MLRAASNYNPAVVAITGGTAKFGDGTAAAPSLGFASIPTSGFFTRAAGNPLVMFSSNSTELLYFGPSGSGTNLSVADGIAFCLTSTGVNAVDTALTREAAGVMAVKFGNTACEFRVSAGNGCYANILTWNESLTILSAASTDSATSIPANAIILAVSVRVTTVIPTAATFTVTTATGGTALNTAAVNVAATSTDVGTKAGAFYQSASTKVRITPNIQPGAATGVVRICAQYIMPNAPTS